MAKAPSNAGANDETTIGISAAQDLPICGMVRPIATMGEAYPETHWMEVHELVAEAAKEAGYRLRLVSESDQVGIIVSEIIRNLHENPVVVVDVSGRNPNVMFELGMRVTFQKPVVIITDDHTPFSFDIQAIRHVPYRRDLRTGPTRKFQSGLTAAIAATVEAASKAGYKGYLQQFGRIEVTGLADQAISLDELAQSVQDLRTEVKSAVVRNQREPSWNKVHPVKDNFNVTVDKTDEANARQIIGATGFMAVPLRLDNGSTRFRMPGVGPDGQRIIIRELTNSGISFEID